MPPVPRVLAPDRDGLAAAAEALRSGLLVAIPTETVYGLGADAFDVAAMQRVFTVKGRPADNPTIVHLADTDELARVVATITPLARDLAARFWPGPLTLVLDARVDVPRVTTGGLSTIAVRVPDHPVATALLRAADLPVAAPSANRSGRPSPTTAAHVVADLGSDVDLVLDGGPCPVGVESTVVDARGERPVVLREGSITRELLGAPLTTELGPDDRLRSPGARYRHYAPTCRLEIVVADEVRSRTAALAAAGERVGLVGSEPPPDGVVDIATFATVAELAQQLYGALRAAEDEGVDVLVVQSVAEAGLGRAVMDRLRRAAD